MVTQKIPLPAAEALHHLLEQLDHDPSLLEPHQLRRRLEALDRLDAYFPDPPAFGDAELYRRAGTLHASLEAANDQLYAAIRQEIQSGGRPDPLLRWAHSLSETEDGTGPANGLGYDHLDELLSGVLRLDEPDTGQIQGQPEIVPYQPTPARHIFRLIHLAALTANDVLVDLGSGLGHVPLLVSLCTPARSIGIELEAAYVQRARQCAQDLNLNRVTFLHQDVRAAHLSTGSVFYLYTPFTGSILSHVLTLLRREAETRPIRICTYGPCTPVIAEEPWLEPAVAPETHRITLFHSRD